MEWQATVAIDGLGNRLGMRTMNLFFELLQVALGTRERLSRVPSSREWQALYDEAKRQAVVGVLLDGLERLPDEQLPPMDIKLQWIGMAQMMAGVYKLHCERAAELTRRFRAVGFKSCVLKGIGTAQYYPMSERRQCGDIDLWVNGRREDVIKWLRTQCKIGNHVWHHVEALFFKDVSVEVHMHPAWMYGPICNRRVQMFFEKNKDSQMVVDETVGFAHPSARFDAVFSIVHSFHHLLEEGIGLRHIVDYFYILRSLSKESHDDVMCMLRSIGLAKFTEAMMWVLHEVFGLDNEYLLCKPNEKEGKFLLSEIIAGGNFGQTRKDGKVRNSFSRWTMMVRHYQSEMLWMVPWKCWHRVWRVVHRGIRGLL